MNSLCAEIILRVECAGIFLEEEHYNGAINFESDALSRLEKGAQIPERLASVPRLTLSERSAQFYWAWPKAEEKPTAAGTGTGRGAQGRRGARLQR